MKDDQLYLRHILECARRARDYAGTKREKFLEDTLLQDAVLRNLQVMTESSQRLSQGFKDRYPDVDWRGLAGFRNILVHDYLGVDMEIVWNLVDQKLSGLIKVVEGELKG